MLRRWVIAGLALVLVGGLALTEGLLAAGPQSRVIVVTAPAPGEFSAPTSSLTQMDVKATWVGGVPSTQTYLVTNDYAPFGFSCGGGGSLVTEGTGAEGSLAAKLTPGEGYLIYGCDGGKPENLTFDLTFSGGLTWGEVLGGVGIGSGGIVMLLGFRTQVADKAEVERIFGPRGPTGPPGV